ncbi:NADH dehydrogenase (ubiquinone) B17 subunit [Leptinotarsa decemlineata]|uniref:NADH dehydrogenase (ubiquinone) B17 subunit n=1 Tax=Leptinotarsa decemlineata TaxID=7539 RepID=UPI003D304494
MGKASNTGGVKPMSIAGRYVDERERLFGMTDAERTFRKQWLKDQELSPNEPRRVPEMYKATYNPIRRAYRWPLDQLAKAIEPVVGAQRAYSIRYFTGKIFLGVVGVYWFTYYFKYNKSDWTRKGGWRVLESRVAVYEGDESYPKLSDKLKGSDYGGRGFNDVKLNL